MYLYPNSSSFSIVVQDFLSSFAYTQACPSWHIQSKGGYVRFRPYWILRFLRVLKNLTFGNQAGYKQASFARFLRIGKLLIPSFCQFFVKHRAINEVTFLKTEDPNTPPVFAQNPNSRNQRQKNLVFKNPKLNRTQCQFCREVNNLQKQST